MYKGGYCGKILRINLTDQTAAEEPLPLKTAKDFIEIMKEFSSKNLDTFINDWFYTIKYIEIIKAHSTIDQLIDYYKK